MYICEGLLSCSCIFRFCPGSFTDDVGRLRKQCDLFIAGKKRTWLYFNGIRHQHFHVHWSVLPHFVHSSGHGIANMIYFPWYKNRGLLATSSSIYENSLGHACVAV